MARVRRPLPKPCPSFRARMPAHPQHLMHFEGGNALSPFRARALLQALQGVSERIAGLSARHVHWVRSAAPLEAPAVDRLAALLRSRTHFKQKISRASPSTSPATSW